MSLSLCPTGAVLRGKLCCISHQAAMLQYCIVQICTAASPSWSWCNFSREVSSLHPSARHQLYLKRAELAGDGGWSGAGGGALDSTNQDFASVQRVNGFPSQSGAPVCFRTLQNQSVKRRFPKHRTGLWLSSCTFISCHETEGWMLLPFSVQETGTRQFSLTYFF